MNTNPGILGLKIGMTQIVLEGGEMIPCTVVQGGSVVVGKRTKEKNGYDALVVGFGDSKIKRVSKPVAGQYRAATKAASEGAAASEDGAENKDVGVTPKQTVREFRCDAEYAAKYQIGQELKLEELFTEGQFVDVRATSRGRGFSGVIRRHNFHGTGASHGAHEVHRHGGSIGTNMTPGRVKPGVKMAGQDGNKNVSVLNQPIMRVIAEKQLLLIRGGIPGSKNRVVEIRGAVKKPVKAG